MKGVALIGTGAIAAIHTDAYAQFADRCRIRTLCDIYPEKADAFARDKGLHDVDILSDYKQAIDRSDIDLVSVCLPPSSHAEVTIFALRAGKNVLVEKPMAPSLAECDAMLVAAEESGRKLSVVSQNRFRTPMLRLKGLIDSGAAGKILHTTVNSFWWRGQSYYDLWWRGTWEKEGGGCTLNHAVHHADLLLWMLGSPEKVYAYFANLNHANSETEDFSTALFVYADGSVSQLNASLIHHGEEQEMIMQAEKARFSVPWKVTASTSLENGFPQNDPKTEEHLFKLYESVPASAHEGHTAQIDNVLSTLESDVELLVDGNAGRRTLELILGIYKSAHSRSMVDLPLDESDPFYRSETMMAVVPHFHEKSISKSNFKTTPITLGRKL